MGVKFNNNDIADIKVGTSQIESVYLGEDLIWEAISNIINISSTNVTNFKYKVNRTTDYITVNIGEDIDYKLPKDKINYVGFRDYAFTKINFTKFNNNEINDLTSFFRDCSQLSSVINIEQLKTSKAKSASYFLHGCSNTNLIINNLNKLDLSNIIDARYMFSQVTSQNILNQINDLDLKNVEDASYMLRETDISDTNCGFFRNNKKSLNLNSFLLDSKINSFRSDYKLKVNSLKAFASGSALENLDLSNIDIDETNADLDLTRFVADCSKLTSITDVYKLFNYAISGLENAFYNSRVTLEENITINTINNENGISFYYAFNNDINIKNEITINGKSSNCGYMFNNCSALKKVNIDNLDTSKVNFFHNMFYNCKSLTSIGQNINTDSGTRFECMFTDCQNLTFNNDIEIDLSSTQRTTSMFKNCKFGQGKSFICKNKDLSNLTDMTEMFNRSGITDEINVDLSGCTWNENGVNMNQFMRYGKYNKVNLNGVLPNNLIIAFIECSIKELDIRNFDTRLVTQMSLPSAWSNGNSYNILYDEKVFNTNSNIDFRGWVWDNEDKIRLFFNTLINHRKSIPYGEENSWWQSEEDYDNWNQTINICSWNDTTKNKIENTPELLALMNEAIDCGWNFKISN